MFEEVARALRQWPEHIQLSHPTQAQVRLLQVVDEIRHGQACGPLDLISLVLQVLREEGLNQVQMIGEGSSELHLSELPELLTLQVPKGNLWPTLEQWKQTGSHVISQARSFLVSDSLWYPHWLPGGASCSPLKRVYSGRLLRPEHAEGYWPLGQKFESLVHTPTFRNEGQHYSVIRSLLAAPGSTHLVVLPTGTGKSLVAYLTAFCSRPKGISVLVVPTTALALDQEERIQQLLAKGGQSRLSSQPIAYHSSLDETSRELIRSRIRTGDQEFLISSPESVDGSLRQALFEAAGLGRLNTLIVDEAHMVCQWGNDFRPSFQMLSNLRNSLAELAPTPERRLKTLLLSATVTEESLRTLRLFFGRDLEMTSAVHLRPEPSFWFAQCSDEAERERRMKDAIAHLPRPWILYVTKVEDAKRWYQWLKGQGVRRVEMMTGRQVEGLDASPTRNSILANWRERKTDIVVATSAFGLGVDQNEVRAIVHACVPETVDRYYQEVGRAGRDGKACLSLVLWCEADLVVAQRLNKQLIISPERGFERWAAMFAEATPDGALLRIDLQTLPSDIIQDSDKNQLWNERTLLLLQRVGFVKMEPKVLPNLHRQEGETQENFDIRFKEALSTYYHQVWIRIQEGVDIHDANALKAAIEPERRAIHEANHKSMTQMLDMLRGSSSVGRVLQDVYRLHLEDTRVLPEHHNISCPLSRALEHNGRDPDLPLNTYPLATFTGVCGKRRWEYFLTKALRCFSNEAGVVWVRLPSVPSVNRQEQLYWEVIRSVLALLARYGFVDFALDSSISRRDLIQKQLEKQSPYPMILFHDGLQRVDCASLNELSEAMEMPRVSLVHRLTNTNHLPFDVRDYARPLHVILFPDTAKFKDSDHRLLTDIEFSISLDKLKEVLTRESAQSYQ